MCIFSIDLKINYLDLKMEMIPDKDKLIELAHYKMPFGKFKGSYLVNLPEAYLLWFREKGFPEGKLGVQLRQILEIKINGLEPLIRKIQKDFPMDSL
jgi:uncharacterized protein (DUF3820 family)